MKQILKTKVEDGKSLGLFHYIGWPSSHDEWRELSQQISLSHYPEISAALKERLAAFKYHLQYLIKKGLTVSSNDDPVIALQLTVDKTVFKAFLHELGHPSGDRLFVRDNKALNKSLKKGWWWHVVSKKKDFAYIIQGTLQMKLKTKGPVADFVTRGGVTAEHLIYGPTTLHINFVKGQGSEHLLDKGDWQKVQQVIEINFKPGVFPACRFSSF